MFFANNEGGSVNKLTPNFKKIPFLALLITISALTVLYFVNTLYGFIDLLAFDVAQEDAINALSNSIVSAVTALIILPLCVCAGISTYSGWKLFVLPRAGAANIAKLGIVAKAIKIYEKYVYVLQAIAMGFVALVFSLYAFVLTGAENLVTDLAKAAQSLGWSPEDADALVKNFENDAPTLAITYIVTFIVIIVFCVFITRAFTAVTDHFVELSDVAEGKKETLPAVPVVTVAVGVVFFLVSAISSFSSGSAFSGITDLLLIAFLVAAVVFFKTVKLDAVETKKEKVVEVEVTEEVVEAENAEAALADETVETAEVEEAPAAIEEAQVEEAPAVVEEVQVEEAPAAVEEVQVEAEPEVVEAEAAAEVTEEPAAEETVEEQNDEAPASEEVESVNA